MARKPKKIYFYDKKSGLPSHEGIAEPNPFSLKRWMIPANATTKKPPKKKKDCVVKWDVYEGKWVNEPISVEAS